MADAVFQGVIAIKTVRSDIFVAFLSLFYFSITVSAKTVTADISYFGAILLKKITRVVFGSRWSMLSKKDDAISTEQKHGVDKLPFEYQRKQTTMKGEIML